MASAHHRCGTESTGRGSGRPRRSIGRGEERGPLDLDGVKALVVENDPPSAKLFALLLDDAGARVTVVESAEEALAIIPNLQPELMVVDLVLPLMSGLLLTQRLKSNPTTRDLVVVAVSALDGPIAERVAREAGCVAYVRKPIDPFSFSTLLVGALRGVK